MRRLFLLAPLLFGCNAITGASGFTVVDDGGPAVDDGSVDDSFDSGSLDSRLPNADAPGESSASDTFAPDSSAPDTFVPDTVSDTFVPDTSSADTFVPDATAAETAFDAADSGAPKAVALGLGQEHSCLVLSNGTAKCWGSGAFGQLGDGLAVSSSTPVLVSGLANATQIAGGDFHSCALGPSGIKCWGGNGVGQLGFTPSAMCTDGFTAGCAKSPGDVVGTAGFTKLLAYAQGNITLDGATGMDTWGQVGSSGSWTLTTYPTTDAVSDIAMGFSHACYLTTGATSSTVKCWGDNGYGQLGRSDLASKDLQAVAGLTDAKKIWAGGSVTCAQKADNSIVCWGSNLYGELGSSTTTKCGTADCSPAPVALTLGGKAVALSLGDGFGCAVLDTGLVKCWGANPYGELGMGGGGVKVPPSTVSITNVQSIASAGRHTCTIGKTSVVKCWGHNNKGQIGDGTTANAYAPTIVSY